MRDVEQLEFLGCSGITLASYDSIKSYVLLREKPDGESLLDGRGRQGCGTGVKGREGWEGIRQGKEAVGRTGQTRMSKARNWKGLGVLG